MSRYFINFTFLLLLNLDIYGQLPNGFSNETVGNFDSPMGVVFDYTGRMFVYERAGKVYMFENNTKHLILDISEEVVTYGDYGVMSMALDPEFTTNGHIYIYYVVDRHHLLYYGTPNYSAGYSEQGATIARLTRFTVNTIDFKSILPNSRYILVGETKNSGFPLTGVWHAGGDIKFANDGSLLVSCGDGAAGADYEQQAYEDQIITLEEYGAPRNWRCQMNTSLSGKIIRINPTNGNGIPSNPYYEISNPRSAKSRIWAMGLRNPFRFSIKPNTGGHILEEGNPGILIVGDVGQDSNEEINFVTQGGQNFGWPNLEGIDFVFSTNPSFDLTNLKSPTVEWGRVGGARVQINNNFFNVSSQNYPYSNFGGGCSIGGDWYTGTSFPIEYQNSYFFADFNDKWVKAMKFDDNNNPISHQDFSSFLDGAIYFSFNSAEDAMYYCSINGNVSKIKYSINSNQAPTASFNSDIQYGKSPLTVFFDASLSSDLENNPLTYSWNFGDNQTSNSITTSHTFISSSNNQQSFNVSLTVSDSFGGTSTISKIISLNNTPPKIISTSLDSLVNFDPINNPTLSLNAVVSDSEDIGSSLIYDWKVFLYHNQHKHPEFSGSHLNEDVIIGGVPCDNILYYYKFLFKVTDSYGLTTSFEKDLHPKCNLNDSIPPSFPNLRVENFTPKSFDIKWDSIIDNDAIKNIELLVNGKTYTFLVGAATEYKYQSTDTLFGKKFNLKIIPRDYAGNFNESSELIFPVPTIQCNGSSSQTYLSDLTPTSSVNGYGPIEMDLSNGADLQNDGNNIRINGQVFSKGIGTHAYSEIIYNLEPNIYQNFKTTIGLDDEMGESNCASAIYKVFKDNVLSYQSNSISTTSPAIPIVINIETASQLKLIVENSGENYNCGIHSDWADAKFIKKCTQFDTKAPSNPLNLVGVVTDSNVFINWEASTDDIDNSIVYEVYLDGNLVDSTLNNSFEIPSFPSGIHNISVQAKDNYGNKAVSKSIRVNKCPNSLLISQNISGNIPFTKKASEFVKVSSQIEAGSNVLFQAGKYLELLPGFLANNGVIFQTKIDGCSE